jgi:hypothetical protein
MNLSSSYAIRNVNAYQSSFSMEAASALAAFQNSLTNHNLFHIIATHISCFQLAECVALSGFQRPRWEMF